VTDAEPQRYLLALAYQAGPDERIRKGQDGARDYFTAAELEKAAFLADGGAQVGLFHGPEQTIGHFDVCESYIYRGPDWDMGDVVVKSGDWLIGGVCDEIAWGLHERGLITGMSPQGTATRRRVRKAEEGGPITAQLLVSGPEDQIAAFANMCRTIQYLCSVGSSRTVQIDVDGDGAGSLRFDLEPLGEESPIDLDADVINCGGIGY
jgi:hypothetical protein